MIWATLAFGSAVVLALAGLERILNISERLHRQRVDADVRAAAMLSSARLSVAGTVRGAA